MGEYVEAKDEVRTELTHVSNTGRYETRPYQCLATDVVPFSLQRVIKNPFRERTERLWGSNLWEFVDRGRNDAQKLLKLGGVEL